MQSLDIDIIKQAKKERLQRLETEIKSSLAGVGVGEMIICPICHYVGKNKKGTCKVFDTSIKCFSCGIWRLR